MWFSNFPRASRVPFFLASHAERLARESCVEHGAHAPLLRLMLRHVTPAASGREVKLDGALRRRVGVSRKNVADGKADARARKNDLFESAAPSPNPELRHTRQRPRDRFAFPALRPPRPPYILCRSRAQPNRAELLGRDIDGIHAHHARWTLCLKLWLRCGPKPTALTLNRIGEFTFALDLALDVADG